MTNGHRGTVQLTQHAPSADPSLEERKAKLRVEAKQRRGQAAKAAGADAAGAAVRERILGAIPFPAGASGPCPVSAYWPMGSELDTRPLIHALHARGHAIGLPVIAGRGMPLVFRAWRPEAPLVPGGFGTEVPGPERPEVRPRLLLVPLLAFDRLGYRLGYGGGFYDRTLALLRATGEVLAVGVAYARQEAPEVPRDAHDQRLDWIVTEAEAIAPG